MIFWDYLTYLIFLPNNNLVMTKFGPRFELFDRIDYTVTESADFGFNPLLRRPRGPQGCLEK